MFQAVLFDLDGTLANSLFDLADCVNHALTKFGYPTRPVENFRYYAGDGITKMVERALPEQHRSPETVAKVQEVFSARYATHYSDKTVAYPGLCQLIDDLKASGIKVAVVTNKAQAFAEIVVKKLYGNRFQVILGMQPGIPAKPDPAGPFLVMKQLGVTPEQCAFIGDTAMDILAGVNAGAYPVGVLWGFREKKELAEAGAKAFAANAEELKTILLEHPQN